MAPRSTAGHLLELIRTGRASTRGELQRVTGLSRSTVGQRLDQLFAAGWLRASGAEESTGGRPSDRLEFDTGHAVVLAADLDANHAPRRGAATWPAPVLAEEHEQLLIDDGPERGARRLDAAVRRLLDEPAPEPRSRSAGSACRRARARSSWTPGMVVQPPIMPGWDGTRSPSRPAARPVGPARSWSTTTPT